MEKEAILNSYKIFLKTCNFDFQIIIQSKKEDLNNHLIKLEQIKEKENKINKIKNKYIENIKNLNSYNKSDSKQFFIVIKEFQENKKEEICVQQLNEKYVKIKEALSRCGNKVVNIKLKEDIKKILEDYLYLK